MEQNISIEEIEEFLMEQNLIYAKYAGIAEGIQEALINAISELDEWESFTKNEITEAIEEIEELTAGVFEYLKENADDIKCSKI